MIIEAAAYNAFFMTQTVESNIKGLTLEDRLVFADAAVQNIAVRQLSTLLGIHDVAKLTKTLNKTVLQILLMSQSANHRVLVQSVEQLFFMWHVGENSTKSPLVRTGLSITQFVDFLTAKGVYDVLTLAQAAIVFGSYNQTIEDTFVIRQGATGFLPDKHWQSGPYTVEAP